MRLPPLLLLPLVLLLLPLVLLGLLPREWVPERPAPSEVQVPVRPAGEP